MSQILRYVYFVLMVGLIALFVSTFFSIWTLWIQMPICKLGTPHSFWYVVKEVRLHRSGEQDPHATYEFEPDDSIQGGVIFVIGCLLGAFGRRAVFRMIPRNLPDSK